MSKADARARPATIASALDRGLGDRNPSLQRHRAALLTLLGGKADEPKWDDLDPRTRRQRMCHAVRDVLVAHAADQPVLLLFDDLHWIDGETQAALDCVVEGLAASRLFLLVTYRPGYENPWTSRAFFTQLQLDPLPPARAAEFSLVRTPIWAPSSRCSSSEPEGIHSSWKRVSAC